MMKELTIEELEHEIAKCVAKIKIYEAEDKLFNTINAPKIKVLRENIQSYADAISRHLDN